MKKKPTTFLDRPPLTRRCSIETCYKTADSHHLKTRGAGGGDDDHNILALCREHHSEVHQVGWSRFIEKYPAVEWLLEEKGWVMEELFGRKRLVRK